MGRVRRMPSAENCLYVQGDSGDHRVEDDQANDAAFSNTYVSKERQRVAGTHVTPTQYPALEARNTLPQALSTPGEHNEPPCRGDIDIDLQSSCCPRIASIPAMIGSPLASRVGTNVSPRMPSASRLICTWQFGRNVGGGDAVKPAFRDLLYL